MHLRQRVRPCMAWPCNLRRNRRRTVVGELHKRSACGQVGVVALNALCRSVTLQCTCPLSCIRLYGLEGM